MYKIVVEFSSDDDATALAYEDMIEKIGVWMVDNIYIDTYKREDSVSEYKEVL